MKLVEKDPEFVVATPGGFFRQGHKIEGAQGILFDCPFPAHSHKIMVWFANPQGASPAGPEHRPTPRWTMTGSGVDDLTLQPSINADHPQYRCWHGWVTKGEIT